MSTGPLLVTGASGQLGRRAIDWLLAHGHKQLIATTRHPDKLAELTARGVDVRRADFDDEASLVHAFRAAERALLISTDAIDRPGHRIEQHQRAVRAFATAGVRQVVYTSLPNPVGSAVSIAPDHAATEAALQASTLDFTILRNNLYADLLLMSLPGAVASGQWVTARGQGAVAYVTRDDCARAAAAALADRSFAGRRTLDVTGERAWTGEQLAGLLSELFSRQVTHLSVPAEAFRAGLVEHGLPPAVAELMTSFEVGIARAELATPTDTVLELTGETPENLASFLERNRAAFTR